ncbi:MAG: lipocalin family protein [Anaerolineales bacterium]|nr:lipocalin family protein [Anaerolineales bacterium]
MAPQRCSIIRTKPGTTSPAVQGTLVEPDGSQHEVTLNDFAIVPIGEWTSPTTGFAYPAGWRVTVPERSIDLTVTPLIPDQEMDVSFIYWEGAVKISGTWQGEPVTGKGYVELTGYGADAGQFNAEPRSVLEPAPARA